MTMEQMIADTVGVTDYLRARFGQDRIILLGHSWGSFLGIQVAARAPDRFLAYVGMAQVVHQLHSEVLSRDHLLSEYRARGDTGMVGRIEAAPASLEAGLSDAWLRLRDSAMHRLGVGTTRDMRSVVKGVFLPVWREPAYTLSEKVGVWRGLAWSRRFLWDEFLRTDLMSRIDRLDIPVYFLIGRHDWTANQGLARDFFHRIEAPLKGFYTFENSAHSPLFEEPDRTRRILRENVLTQRIDLADPNP